MGKRFVRKLLAVMVIVAMMADLTACGTGLENPIDQEEPEQTTQGITDENPAFAETVEGLKEDIRLYGYEEPITLKMGFSFGTDFDWEGEESFADNTWKRLYEELGYETEVLYNVDDNQSDTKLAIAITSGNYPDIVSGSATEIVKYAETGVIADITEVFEEYAEKNHPELPVLT
ncbi:MAG: extracellular solute-binding protein, partial [Muribaculum sp.]|nr:extracellular solute-binding protein [Muribaculum sp.]